MSLSSFLDLVSSRRQSLQIAGQSFPVPQRLKEKLFYESDTSDERLRRLREAHPGTKILKKDILKNPLKKSAVSVLVSSFERSKYLSLLDGKLLEDSVPNAKQINNRIVREVLIDEKAASRFREETAEASILSKLKQQKYG